MIQELLTLRLQQMLDGAYYGTQCVLQPQQTIPYLLNFMQNGFQVNPIEPHFGMAPTTANSVYSTILLMGLGTAAYAGYQLYSFHENNVRIAPLANIALQNNIHHRPYQNTPRHRT